MAKYRKCAYCGKREYDLKTMVGVPSRTYRSESQFAHRRCFRDVEKRSWHKGIKK